MVLAGIRRLAAHIKSIVRDDLLRAREVEMLWCFELEARCSGRMNCRQERHFGAVRPEFRVVRPTVFTTVAAGLRRDPSRNPGREAKRPTVVNTGG